MTVSASHGGACVKQVSQGFEAKHYGLICGNTDISNHCLDAALYWRIYAPSLSRSSGERSVAAHGLE
jgi:hypothetical protein